MGRLTLNGRKHPQGYLVELGTVEDFVCALPPTS